VIVQRAPNRAGGPRQFLAFGVTLLGHIAIVVALFTLMRPPLRPAPERVVYVTPEALQPPPPGSPKPETKPPPAPVPVPQIVEAPKPVEKPRRPAPAPAAHPPPSESGPSVHYFGSGPSAGSAAASGLGSAGDGVAGTRRPTTPRK